MAFPHDHRTRRLLERERSFSLIFFDGSVHEAIPEFLVACGYRVLARGRIEGPFDEAYEALCDIESPSDGVVHKGGCGLPGGTVLLDPEMVLGFGSEDALRQFCGAHNVCSIVAVWERVSETVACRELDSLGVRSSTFLLRGEPDGDQLRPIEGLQRDPTGAGLVTVLDSLGLPVADMFGDVDIAVWRLEE